MDLKLYGKSEQKQYSGKNLFPPVTYIGNVSNLQIDAADGAVHLKGTPNDQVNSAIIGAWSASSPTIFTLPAGTYTLSGFGEWLSTPRLNLVYVENGELISLSGNKTVTFDKETNFIAVFVYADANVALNITFKPMIEKGSTATAYEPYVGGIPSPNPEYPQEIKSVVKPVVKVMGKNLFDNVNKSIDTDGWTTTKIAYIPKGKYVYKRFVDANSNGQINTQLYALIDGTWKIITSAGTTSFDDGGITFIGENWNMGWGTTGKVDFELKKGYYMRASNPSDKVHLMLVAGDTEPTEYEEYKGTTATLPYTLNAIPVSSGGNITVDGQQYIADYVDVERGKLVRMVDSSKLDTTQSIIDKTDWLLATPTETDLTADEIAAFKALASHYPVTNVSTTSDQLDGYTVFDYPISLANGWNYVKQQLGDTRDYLYGIDLMTAEAYVNSEYAAALAEIEV